MDEEEDDEVIKELYNDVNMNLGNRDADMTDTDQGGADQQNKNDKPVQSSSVSSDFTSKLLNLENPSLTDNEIASLIDTIVHHKEPRSQTSSLYTVLIMAVPEITSIFTTTIPPPPHFFNPLPQQATPTPTQQLLKLQSHFLHFQISYLYSSSTTEEEAQAEKMDYIELVDTSMRAILKEVVNTQLPQILPQAVSDFATPMIEKNVT
ncbi:hypothetical protein Tco_1531535 [Tanacetum coccineum]